MYGRTSNWFTVLSPDDCFFSWELMHKVCPLRSALLWSDLAQWLWLKCFFYSRRSNPPLRSWASTRPRSSATTNRNSPSPPPTRSTKFSPTPLHVIRKYPGNPGIGSLFQQNQPINIQQVLEMCRSSSASRVNKWEPHNSRRFSSLEDLRETVENVDLYVFSNCCLKGVKLKLSFLY